MSLLLQSFRGWEETLEGTELAWSVKWRRREALPRLS